MIMLVDQYRSLNRFNNKQLKFGPGNAWIIANPSRKSLDETHPGATTYLLMLGII